MVEEVKDFNADVVNNDKLVVIDFWGENCPPCKQFSPVFDKVAGKLGGKMDFFKANVHDQAFAGEFVRSIPTVIVFDKGNPIEQFVGIMSEDDLVSKLQDLLG